MLRDQPHYRRDAFMSGLKAAGYDARVGPPSSVEPGDVLCIWNRGDMHDLATQFEKRGGTVVVSENGYVGPGGISPHQMEPRSIYALAIGGHNGSGRWNVGGPERWQALGVELKPWRTEGDHILVCPNRSFGRPDMLMPLNWAADVTKRLQRVTKRPIRVRPHPGNGAPKTPLSRDLEGAWLTVIWSSSAGVQSLIQGVPVFRQAPHWICGPASETDLSLVETPWRYVTAFCVQSTMQRLAWAQWSVTEIATGVPFRYLLSDSRKIESAAAL